VNFFERQRQLRRLSVRLVFLFLVAVAGIIVVIDLAVAFATGAFSDSDSGQLATNLGFTSVSVAAAVGLAALVRTAALRGGGGRVARELGGVPVPPDTQDPQLRRLRNVVEEMAIAAGVSVPEIYVLPNETSINAFAAGWSTSDAAVAVTRGAMDRLSRDELQGVIAHEFSHVVNGDMRLNIRLIGLLFGILFLSIIGRNLIFFGGGRGGRDNRNPVPLIGIALLIAGGIGVLVGRIIQASVSRQREYLADASAVQYTRQTDGLAGALKKIGGLPAGSQLRNPRRDEVGHMLFGPGARLSSIFATHPPLSDRIKALDPTFDPAELEQLRRRWASEPPSGLAEDRARGLAEPGVARPARRVALPDPASRSAVDAGALIDSVANVPASTPDYAAALISQIPDPVRERAHRIDTVVPLVLGLLMAEDEQARMVQYQELARDHGRPLADASAQEAQALAGMHPILRVPLAELAFPALKARSEAERRDVLVAVSGLIHADNTITAYEYCVARLIYSELYESMQPDYGRRSGSDTAAARWNEVATLLAVLAHAGSDPAVAEQAFAAGIAQILPGRSVPYRPPPTGVLALEDGWPGLASLRPEDKQRLVAAIVATVGYDETVSVTESELLRTVCALIHCPIPPLPVSLASQ
jgi:Zn-dependent protease with chaperone function